MNVLFLTTGIVCSIEAHNIYSDLFRKFRDVGHNIFIVVPGERRNNMKTSTYDEHGTHMLNVRIGNISKCGILEKGISTLMIESLFKAAIDKYFAGVKFDLVMYTTPPVTLAGVVAYIKKRDGAKCYLLLKDIFPQNAVDLGMLAKTGVKGILYRMFRAKEKQLYAVSDGIGCMSEANREYLLKHNPEIDPGRVEVCPNSIEIVEFNVSQEEKRRMRRKYGIPEDKTVFLFGGNLGRPQSIPYIIDCIRSQKYKSEVLFLIIGSGTEYEKLEAFHKEEKQENFMLMNTLPRDDYDYMAASCDVGLIFLDHRFTIPNFPSRILAYMQAKLPVLAATDPNTDIGKVITDGGFGWWCESESVEEFEKLVNEACMSDRKSMGLAGNKYLREHYTVDRIYETIINYLELETV